MSICASGRGFTVQHPHYDFLWYRFTWQSFTLEFNRCRNITFSVRLKNTHIVSWEPEGRYCRSKMFCWEPEGRYCHWHCTAIASFWFSMEHLWTGNNTLLALNQCCVRVQVVKSESESASPSQKKILVRVTNLVVHIVNICLSSNTWKQTTKCIECQSKQRNTAWPLLLGLGRDSGPSHESPFLSPSPSQSEQNWTRVRVRVRVPTRVTQHCSQLTILLCTESGWVVRSC